MKNKPRHLNLIAAVILAVAIALPLQIMILYGNPPTEIAAIAAKLSPLNWLILFSCPIVAVLVYRASPLLLAAAPLLGALVVYNNWFVGQIATDYAPWATGLASILFCVTLAAIFTSDVRKILLNPGLRWWQTPERMSAEVPMRLRILNGRYKSGREEFYTVTFDISESGAFIPFGRERGQVRELRGAEGFSMRNLVPGTQCYICLSLGDLAFIHCRAEVVRVAPPSGKYPAGVGIRFLGLTGQEKRTIGAFMDDFDHEQQSLAGAPAAPGNSGRLAA